MANRPPLAIDEWYHCFTRGVDKRKTFQTKRDYERFLQVLYLANNEAVAQRSNLLTMRHEKIFSYPRGKPLVSLCAYCIMPNHFHLLMQEIREGGIARFMQKVGISYAMYFNLKNQRVGNLFVKPFRSRHVDSDEYLRYVAQYIHLNHAELIDPHWKTALEKNTKKMETALREYPYSSLRDYFGEARPESAILDPNAVAMMRDGMPPLKEIVNDAAEYYQTIGAN